MRIFITVASFLLLTSSGFSTIVSVTNEPASKVLPKWIKSAKQPVDIRASKIESIACIHAISIASRHTHVRVMIDTVTPELLLLAKRLGENLQVRVAPPVFQERMLDFEWGEDPDRSALKAIRVPLKSSWVNIGTYESWNGALVWNSKSLAPHFELVGESGEASWERSPGELHFFRVMFRDGIPLQRYL